MPARPLWTPRPILLRPTGFSVHYETQVCDRHGRVLRTLQRGKNTITNFGMDVLAASSLPTQLAYLNLSDTTETRKRQLQGGNNLTLTYTSETNIGVVADTSFFEAADASAGRTLVVPNVPELKISSFTSATQVTCRTPSGFWLPGFTPPAPTGYASGAVYYNSINTLKTWFTKFNTYDTGGNNFQATDASNSRFIHSRIYLSAPVTGSNWTVLQLGWSDGNASNNCFGIVNLGSADTIIIGNRYRVVLTVYSNYTPINLAAVAINWGGTIGSYTVDIRQEMIEKDVESTFLGNLLQPHASTICRTAYKTSAHTLVSTYWHGQSGGTPPATGFTSTADNGSIGAYTNGEFSRTKNLRWPDGIAITSATALSGERQNNLYPGITLRPTTGTITKPIGFWCDATFRIFWTRDLPV